MIHLSGSTVLVHLNNDILIPTKTYYNYGVFGSRSFAWWDDSYFHFASFNQWVLHFIDYFSLLLIDNIKRIRLYHECMSWSVQSGMHQILRQEWLTIFTRHRQSFQQKMTPFVSIPFTKQYYFLIEKHWNSISWASYLKTFHCLFRGRRQLFQTRPTVPDTSLCRWCKYILSTLPML